MTIPVLPIPDTRPGFSSQSPGIGGAIAGGLEGIIQALLARAKMQQQQQGLDLESARNQQNAQYQQGMLQNEQSRQQAELAAALQGRQDQGQIGNALQQMMSGSSSMMLPQAGGVSAPVSMPTGVSPEQAMGQLPDYLKSEFLKQGKDTIAAREKQTEIKRQDQARQAYLKALPPALRQVAELRWSAKEGGMGEKEIDELTAGFYTQGADPATLALIDKRYPMAAGLPPAKKVELFMKDMEGQIAAKYRVSGMDLPLKFSESARLRGEFQKSPQAETYQMARTAMEQMDALSSDNTGASDINLLIAAAKVADPNSVVREGEVAIQRTAASLSDKIGVKYENLLRGQILSPKQRQELLKAARSRLKPVEDAFARQRAYYTQLTTGFGGNPFEVVGPEMEPYKPRPVSAKPAPSGYNYDALRREGDALGRKP